MLKKELSQAEALGVAESLNLTKYIELDNMIQSMHIDGGKNTKVLIATSDLNAANFVLRSFFDIDARIKPEVRFQLCAAYGEPDYSIFTEYGEMSVSKELLTNMISSSQSKLECAMSATIESLKNIKITLAYFPQYKSVNADTWRYMLMESDYTIMILAAHHILYAAEQDFMIRQVLPLYSDTRLIFGIAGVENIKAAEWPDSIGRVKLLLGEDFTVFPIFTEEISDKRRDRFEGSDMTLTSILTGLQSRLIDLRKQHVEDINNYKLFFLEGELMDLKHRLEESTANKAEDSIIAEKDRKILESSKRHIKDNISLFLESPLMAKYRASINEFTELFIKSTKEDIMASKDIKKDSRALPRYISFIWDQFTDIQNRELASEFRKESSVLLDMMRLDLRNITRNIKDADIRTDIDDKLESSFNVHTFFARKSSAGNGLTDTLTIGGLLALFVVPVGGVAAIIGSELIKVFGKESIDNDYKKSLCEKIENVIQGNRDELLRQADSNFYNVAECFGKEIIAYYDEMIETVDSSISRDKEILATATEKLGMIQNLI